jgi:leucyl aminopeptidase
LSKYKFDKYKTKKDEININIIFNKDNKKLIEERLQTIENIKLARDL